VAVKLRLVRMGKKKQPTYRVVAAESRRARSGAFLEIVGTYQPRGLSAANPETVFDIDNAKALHWLQHGAQPTDRVRKLLQASGALDEFAASKAAKAEKAAQ
jgi:small subunit ribosomal protein S16